MRRMIRKAGFEESQYAHPIALGGTDSMTLEQASKKLNFVKQSKVGQASGYAKLTAKALLPIELLPLDSVTQNKISVGLTQEALAGRTNMYKITNFDSFTNYSISCTVGEVSLVGDDITYRLPVGATSGGFTINGEYFALAVTTPFVKVPFIVTPPNNTTGIGHTYTVTASDFAVATGTDTHVSSSWQLSTSPAFGAITKSSFDDTNSKTRWDLTQLDYGVDYYVRVRYTGAINGTSEWSQATKFTTLEPIILEKPTFVNITNAQILSYPFTAPVLIQTSPFATISGVDEHIYSKLTVLSDAQVPLATLDPGAAVTSFDINGLYSFDADTVYCLKVEYTGLSGLKVSSDVISFKTEDDKFYPVFVIDESDDDDLTVVDYYTYKVTGLPPEYAFSVETKDISTGLISIQNHTSDVHGTVDFTRYFTHVELAGYNELKVLYPSHQGKPVGTGTVTRQLTAVSPALFFDKIGYTSVDNVKWHLHGGFPNTTVDVEVYLDNVLKETFYVTLSDVGSSVEQIFRLNDSYVGELKFMAKFPGVPGPRATLGRVTTVGLYVYRPEVIVAPTDIVLGDNFSLTIVGGKPNSNVNVKIFYNNIEVNNVVLRLDNMGYIFADLVPEGGFDWTGVWSGEFNFGDNGGIVQRTVRIRERVYRPELLLPTTIIRFGESFIASVHSGKPFERFTFTIKYFDAEFPNGVSLGEFTAHFNASGVNSTPYTPEHFTRMGRYEFTVNFGIYGGIVIKSVVVGSSSYEPVITIPRYRVRYGEDIIVKIAGGKPNTNFRFKTKITNADFPSGQGINDMDIGLDIDGNHEATYPLAAYLFPGTWEGSFDFGIHGGVMVKAVEVVDGEYFPAIQTPVNPVLVNTSFDIRVANGRAAESFKLDLKFNGILVNSLNFVLDNAGGILLQNVVPDMVMIGSWDLEFDFGQFGGKITRNIPVVEEIYSPILTGPAAPVVHGTDFEINITGGKPNSEFKVIVKLDNAFVNQLRARFDEFGAILITFTEETALTPGRWSGEFDFGVYGGVKKIEVDIIRKFNPVVTYPLGPVVFGADFSISVFGGPPNTTIYAVNNFNGVFVSKLPILLDNLGNYVITYNQEDYMVPGFWAGEMDFGLDGGTVPYTVDIVKDFAPVVTTPLEMVKFGDDFTVLVSKGKPNSAVRTKITYNGQSLGESNFVLDNMGAWVTVVRKEDYLIPGTWVVTFDFGSDGGEITKTVTVSEESSLRVYRPTIMAPTVPVPFGNSFDFVINGGKPGAVVSLSYRLVNSLIPEGTPTMYMTIALDLNGSWHKTYVKNDYLYGGTWIVNLDFGEHGGQMNRNVEITEELVAPPPPEPEPTYNPVINAASTITVGDTIDWGVIGGRPNQVVPVKFTVVIAGVSASNDSHVTLDSSGSFTRSEQLDNYGNTVSTWTAELNFGSYGGVRSKTVSVLAADAPAVGDSHTHTNKSDMDKLTETGDGYLRFNSGPAINVFLVAQDW